jgi:tetratricopeptide (TPR) repeat protein
MKRLSLAVALLWWVAIAAHDQSSTNLVPRVDARAEVAAALYAASATQAAAERVTDATIRAQRVEIERLRANVRVGAGRGEQLRAALTTLQDEYVTALAARDRAYAEEIAVFRTAVQDIAATPEGAAALARFNAGDEISALAILDTLRSARDTARQKRADVESAAEARRIATLALEARAKGKLLTLQVIARYEEVTQLDPGVYWDWVELSRLYRAAGKPPDALRAAKAAAGTATNERERAISLDTAGDALFEQRDRLAALASYQASLTLLQQLAKSNPGDTGRQWDLSIAQSKVGDVLFYVQGDRLAALASYQDSLTILEGLVKAAPNAADWQRNLSVAHDKIGDVLVAQGESSAALASYQTALAISERLSKSDPSYALWQQDLSTWHNKIGNVLQEQGERTAALANYRASLSIRERLAKADPDNAAWQRNLLVAYGYVGEALLAQGERSAALASFQASVAIAERLAKVDPGPQGQRDLAVLHNKIGDVLVAQGERLRALASYQASLNIAERLTEGDPGNAEWQRDMVVSLVKLNDVTSDKAYAARALDTVLAMQQRGILAPRDSWMIEELKRRAGR